MAKFFFIFCAKSTKLLNRIYFFYNRTYIFSNISLSNSPINPRNLQKKNPSEITFQSCKSIQPSVDIFIPTYNEPVDILARTIIGCQLVEYEKKIIYILDDGNRTEIKVLASRLGCEYISREINYHAKAGNLNNAIKRTDSELIAVFDADFIPTSNFLEETVQFFIDPELALLQTNLSYLNPDPILKNLGVANKFPNESEIFSSHYQLLRNSVGNAMCCGSSFLIRREHINKINGFETESLSEDTYTSIKLFSHGYKIKFLNKKLSAGLSPETLQARLLQHLRWTRGTIQSFFISSNPLTIPRLNISTRISHIGTLVYRLTHVLRLLLFLIPALSIFLHLPIINTSTKELLVYLLPFYLLFMATYSILNRGTQSFFISDIYTVTQCFHLSLCILKTILSPFSKDFVVTPKGLYLRISIFCNKNLLMPLVFFYILNLASLFYLLKHIADNAINSTIIINFTLVIYNLIVINFSCLSIIPLDKSTISNLLSSDLKVSLCSEVDPPQSQRFSEGELLNINPLVIKLYTKNKHDHILEKFPLKIGVKIYIENADFYIHSHVEEIVVSSNYISLILSNSVDYTDISYKKIISLLFCQPETWQKKKTKNDVQVIWILLKVTMRKNVKLLRLVVRKILLWI